MNQQTQTSNTWRLYTWTWQLLSPMSIGVGPAGSLQRCRLYVPARTLAAALHAEIALHDPPDQNGMPQYDKIGHEMGIHCRFSNLFPAEKQGDRYLTWLPSYTPSNGLVWETCNPQNRQRLSHRAFRRRLLDARAQTAVTPHTLAAADQTLRELDFVNPFWKHPRRPPGEPPAPLCLRGFFFLHDNHFSNKLRSITEIRVGGERRNGMGRLRLLEPPREIRPEDLTAEWDCSLSPPAENGPRIRSRRLLAHAPVHTVPADIPIRGALEYLRGYHAGELRGVRKHDHHGLLAWTPGSVAGTDGAPPAWTIDRFGLWIQ